MTAITESTTLLELAVMISEALADHRVENIDDPARVSGIHGGLLL